MSQLLDFVLDAHGGLENWKSVTGVDMRLTLGGLSLLKRHDYFTDVAKGNVAHYCMDYRTFDGFAFPTRRRVVGRGEGDFAATAGPSTVQPAREQAATRLH